jgi:trehalose 6-phosphate phosphatase
MTILPRPGAAQLPRPPLVAPVDHGLFVDFDGTLVDLVDRPDQVGADDELIGLLRALSAAFGDRLAIVSGRSIEQLDHMIGADAGSIILAGSHGAEIRRAGHLFRPARAVGLDDAAADLGAFAARHPAMIVEVKSLGVALHYRMVPEAEDDAVAAAGEVAARLGLAIQPGKMMIELHGAGYDKGTALRELTAREANPASRPVMIGDDLTDEPALAAAAELGGFGVLVGPPRETAAVYGLPDVGAVRAWLWSIIR